MTHAPEIILMPKIQNIPYWNSRLDELVSQVGKLFVAKYPTQTHTVLWNKQYSLAALVPFALAELDQRAKFLRHDDWKRYIDGYLDLRQKREPGAPKTTVVLSDESADVIQRIGAIIDGAGEWKGTHLKRDVKDKQGVKIGEVFNAPLVIIVALQYVKETLKA